MRTGTQSHRRSLRDLGVATKIIAAVAVSSLAALIVGVVGLSSLSSTAAQTQHMYRSDALGVDLVQEMRFQLMSIRFNGLNRTYSTDPAAVAKFADARQTGREAFQAAGARYIAETGPKAAQRAIVQDATTGMDQYFALVGQLDELAAAKNMVAWNQLRDAQVSPLTAKIVDDLNKLVQAQLDQASSRAQDAQQSYTSTRTTLIVVLVIGIIAALGAGVFVARAITGALRKLRDAAGRLAEGDLTTSTGVDQRDEVGQTAAALDEALMGLRSVMASVAASADAVAASSEELSASSAQISASAEETSAQSGVVSSAAEEVSRNVATVAAGAEQMGASIREISQNANEAA
ncbi:MAG: methyl-accepting chemotaxis protein, partial [Modestobacter sp.]|nr:methyl-accepting chemotaxis protein [Modestobacter sp.]